MACRSRIATVPRAPRELLIKCVVARRLDEPRVHLSFFAPFREGRFQLRLRVERQPCSPCLHG